MIILRTILLAAVCCWCSCGSRKTGKKEIATAATAATNFPYNIQSPSKRFELPKQLHEISGIAAVTDDLVACIGDEKGTVYFYNLSSGEIENKLKFTGKGDFEDITIVGDIIYVLDSHGVIWEIKNYSKDPVINSYPLDIEKPFELEGLCHRGDTLFIAAKYYHNKKRDTPGLLPVWRLSSTMQVQAPLFNLEDTMQPQGKEVPFHTAGLVFDEELQEWLCISTHTKIMVRCGYAGNIISTEALSEKEFLQPEGICFTPSGDLLISNEGRDEEGTILLFSKNKKP